MINVSPTEYICKFDSDVVPGTATAWTLTSPDAAVWGASITTSGVLSFASGASAGDSAVAIGLDGIKWDPTISNGGVVTFTSGSAISGSDTVAAITDSGGTVWSVYVNDNNEVCLTTGPVVQSLVRYPALRLSYTPASASDLFLLHSARLNINIRRKSS